MLGQTHHFACLAQLLGEGDITDASALHCPLPVDLFGNQERDISYVFRSCTKAADLTMPWTTILAPGHTSRKL